MLQVCSSFPVASGEVLAGFGLWRDFAVCHSSEGSCERRGGSGAACAETAALGMQSGSSAASESKLYLFNEHPHRYQGFLWG